MKKGIHEIRKNKGIGSHSAFLAGDFLHFQSDFIALKQQNKHADPESTRRMLVTIVSIFESFYKEIFAGYIDSGEPYLGRAAKLHKKDKPEVSFDTLTGLAKKTFSIGELYAYTMKYNSLNQIRENYELITDTDYLDHIKTFNKPLKGSDLSEVSRAKVDIEKIFSSLNKVFVMRHSLVHEYPANDVNVSLDEIIDYLDAAWLLLMTTDRIYWTDIKVDNPFAFDDISEVK